MKNLKQLHLRRLWVLLAMCGFAFLLAPAHSVAQSSGPVINVCSSGSVSYAEETVCLYGDVSSTVRSTASAYLTECCYLSQIGVDLQLLDNGTLVADTGEPGYTYESTTPVTAHAGHTYVATGWIDGCYGDPGSCYWYYHMTSMSAQGQITGVQGYINPKFIVLGVTYAPPGPQSSVTYTNSQSMGNTTSLANSISSGTSYSVSITYSGGILGWKGGTTLGSSNSSMQTTKDGQSTTINWAVTNIIATPGTPTAVVNGAYTSPVNHDYDIVYIWLNPVEVLSLGQGSVVWNGYGYDANDQNGMDIVGISLGYLNGDFGPVPSQFQTLLSRSWASDQVYPPGEGAAINASDLATIAQSDPFSNSSYGADQIGPDPPVPTTPDNRFTITACNNQNSEPFTQADPSQPPGTVTCTLSYSDMTTNAHSYTTSSTTIYSVDRAFQGTGWLANFKLDFNSDSTTTTTTEVDSSISSTQSSSASLTIVGLPCDNQVPYQGPCVPVYPGPPTFPIQFMIYQDDLWGTFMFAPVDYY